MIRAGSTGAHPRYPGHRTGRGDPEGRLERGASPGIHRPHPRRRPHRRGSDRDRQRLHQRRAGARRAGGDGAALPGRERAGAGARQREAAPAHLLAGARRQSHPHDQRHRHRAVGHSRPGHRAAGGPAAGRPLPRAGAALRLAADGPTGAAGGAPAPDRGARLPRLQDRLGAVRPRQPRRSTSGSSAPRATRSAPTRC